MSLIYRYRLFPVSQPIPSLGGRWVRPRPIVPVSITGPMDTRARDALLDSAADDTIFPERLAADIGIDLRNTPRGVGRGVGMAAVPVRFAQVVLRLADGKETREWSAVVAFTSAQLYRPLLGFAGCLQFFAANFRGDLEAVELIANSLYPGT
jgi:hypothetical protein